MGGWFDPEGEGWFDPEEGQGWFDEDFLEGGPTIVEGEFSFAGVSAFSGVGGSIAGGVFSFAGVADFSPFDGGDAAEPPLTTAKEDTLFLCLASALTTDSSQRLTDLTSYTGGGYELTSSRGAVTGATGREVYCRCVLTAGETDVTLVYHGLGDFSDYTYAMGTEATGKLVCRQNGAAIWTGPTAPAGDISFAWSTRENPDTTGSGNALISEVSVYDHTAGSMLRIEQFTHAVATTSSSWTFSIGGWWNGSSLRGPPATAPTEARLSEAFHNHVEFSEDWVAARTPHTTTYDQILEPVGTSLAGAQAEWAGQANVGYLAAQARELRGRMLSPLINEVYPRARQLTTTLGPVGWMIGAPSSSVYKMDVTGLRWVAVPPGVKYAWVRVNVQSGVTGGAAVPIGIRCYSMNRPHIGAGVMLGGKPIPALKTHFAEGTLTVDHGATPGEWIDLGLLPLSVFSESVPGWTNTTTLILAHAIDPAGASANDAAERLKIRAWHVRPILGEP